MADKNVSIDIIAADRTKAAFESVKRGLGEVDSKLSVIKGTFGAFSALAASAGLTQIVTAAVQAAAAAEDSSKRLNAVLRATGDTVGFTRDQLDQMADSLAKTTTFDDEGVRDAMAVLTKFGKLHGDVFEKALKLSADYAAFTGGDMAEAAQAVGRAFADPVEGGMMLERQFGKLSDAQEESIRKFVEQGRIMEAQQVWIEKLESSIGGTAGEMNAGLTGAMKSAGKAWDELMETMGKSGPSKIIVENGLLSISNLLTLVKEKMEQINAETSRSIFSGGRLTQKLTPEQGGPRGNLSGLPDLPKDLTVEQVAAAGRAGRAAQDEAEAARQAAALVAQKKLDAARLKMANDLMDQQVAIMKQGDKELADLREAARKEQMEWNEGQGEDLRALFEADRAQRLEQDIEAGEDMKSLRETYIQEQDEKYRVFREKLTQNLMTEQEELRFHYDEDFMMLNDANARKYISHVEYYELMGRLVRKHEKDRTALEDAEIRKRFGIANVYRRLDVNSASFFFDQMGALMQTKSRTLFEIGKAGAIAGAIIDTYKAATGAYAALAGIPIVGPALGAAAAAAAVAVGMARVSAIKSTTMGGGGGAVGTFAANPSTGLPEDPTSSGFDSAVSPISQTRQTQRPMNLNIQFVGSGRYTQEEIRDSLVPALKEAFGDGLTVN